MFPSTAILASSRTAWHCAFWGGATAILTAGTRQRARRLPGPGVLCAPRLLCAQAGRSHLWRPTQGSPGRQPALLGAQRTYSGSRASPVPPSPGGHTCPAWGEDPGIQHQPCTGWGFSHTWVGSRRPPGHCQGVLCLDPAHCPPLLFLSHCLSGKTCCFPAQAHSTPVSSLHPGDRAYPSIPPLWCPGHLGVPGPALHGASCWKRVMEGRGPPLPQRLQ